VGRGSVRDLDRRRRQRGVDIPRAPHLPTHRRAFGVTARVIDQRESLVGQIPAARRLDRRPAALPGPRVPQHAGHPAGTASLICARLGSPS
jgi:hypothetical protein